MQSLIEDSLHPERSSIEVYHHLYLTSRYLNALYKRKRYESIVPIQENIMMQINQLKESLLKIQQPKGTRVYQGWCLK